MVPKNQKKSKAPKPKEEKGAHHRAAQQQNKEGFACPVCWVVPETIRNDGVSTARHLPGSSGAAKFRDSEYCNGQGQVGRYVLDKGWKPGHEPQNSITAKEFTAHGTERYEERQKRREEREQGKAKRTTRAKPEPKAKPAKRAVKGKTARPKRRPKAEVEAESSESQEADQEAATETQGQAAA